MINPEKIDEWIHEVEERPSSATMIIQYIAGRLRDLTQRNEELLSENIALLSGKKVEEYEARIAKLEYQMGLLRRQLGGEIDISSLPGPITVDTLNLLIYKPSGQVLRVEFNPSELVSGEVFANFQDAFGSQEDPPGLLVTGIQEELLFVFDSGRTVTQPVNTISVVNRKDLDWSGANLVKTRGSEKLAAILPIARMILFDYCIQTSRKGFVKKIQENFMESFLANAYIGKGVQQPFDKMFSLVWVNQKDRFAILSYEGFLCAMEVERLPVNIEEVIQLSPTDHIVAAFTLTEKPSLLVMTQNGKAIHREASWVEKASSFRLRGQPVFSKERRESGVRVVGAASVDEKDWGLVCRSDGQLLAYRMQDLYDTGAVLPPESSLYIVNFLAFTVPEA